MADVVLDNISNKENGKDDSDHREGEEQVVYAMVAEPMCQEIIRVIQGVF